MKKTQKDKYKVRADFLYTKYAAAVIELGTLLDNTLEEYRVLQELMSRREVESALRVALADEGVAKVMEESAVKIAFIEFASRNFVAKHKHHLEVHKCQSNSTT